MIAGWSARRLASVVCAGLLLVLAFSLTAVPTAHGETLGSWNPSTTYSNPKYSYETGGSCVTYLGYIYCVGGWIAYTPFNYTVSAPISGSGVGTWTSRTSYPQKFAYGSCVAASGYIYCVGGENSSSTFSKAVYSATISNGVVGAWQSTTSYPSAMALMSCAAASGYIYCVGGSADTSYPEWPSNAVFYASISGGTVGAWQSTTYPTVIDEASCAISSGYLYCVAGNTVTMIGGEETVVISQIVEYVPLATSGGGSFSSTTSYPSYVYAASCGTYSGYIYCVGGLTNPAGTFTDDVYYAPVSSSGVGAWTNSTNYYPITIAFESCPISSNFIYCVGGQTTGSFIVGNTYFAPISGGSTTSSSSTSSSASTSSTSSSSSTTLVCPSVFGGVLMPPGATFTDSYGNTWIAPSGDAGGGGYWSSYFFAGPASYVPPPMMLGWGGTYGTYDGQEGWIVTFYC